MNYFRFFCFGFPALGWRQCTRTGIDARVNRCPAHRVRIVHEHSFDKLVVKQARTINELVQHPRRKRLSRRLIVDGRWLRATRFERWSCQGRSQCDFRRRSYGFFRGLTNNLERCGNSRIDITPRNIAKTTFHLAFRVATASPVWRCKTFRHLPRPSLTAVPVLDERRVCASGDPYLRMRRELHAAKRIKESGPMGSD